MTAVTQIPSGTERVVAGLEFVRERVCDEERRVIHPTSIFESADGERRYGMDVEHETEPCRACLVGWSEYVDVAHLGEEAGGFGTVSTLIEQACDDLDIQQDREDSCQVTQATREGPATLNRVIDRAVYLAREGVIS
jgi:hypothetical protein